MEATTTGSGAEVTIPLAAEATRAVDPALFLAERYAAQGLEPPLTKPLSRRAERAVIGGIGVVVAAITVLAFTLHRPSSTGAGFLFVGVGGAVLAALIWAHMSGGIDRKARALPGRDRPAAAAAESRSIARTYRLAPARARLMAWVVDQVLAFVPFLILLLLRGLHVVPKPMFTGLALPGFVVFMLAAPVSLWLTDGRTPGLRLLRIRVVCADGTRMTLRRAVRRQLGRLGRGDPLGALLSLAAMRVDELHRSQADTRAGTVVVVDDAC